jgi:AraC-like DNA-binding protein
MPRPLARVIAEGEWPPLTDLQPGEGSDAAGGLWCYAREGTPILDRGTHMHNTLELGWVLSGAKRYRIGDARFVVRPGEIWSATMWEPHTWEVIRPRTRFVSINFSPEFLIQTAGALSWFAVFSVPASQRPRTADAPSRRLVRVLGGDLYHAIVARPAGWESRVRFGLAYLVSLYLRGWNPPAYPPPLPADSVSGLSRIMPAVSLTAARPGARINRREAATACSLSPSRFHGLFRATMSLTFEQFCRQSRLAFARHLLLTSGLTMAAIAERTGFSDESHFPRAFSTYHGCTPAAYRRYLGSPPGYSPDGHMLVRHASHAAVD